MYRVIKLQHLKVFFKARHANPFSWHDFLIGLNHFLPEKRFLQNYFLDLVKFSKKCLRYHYREPCH